MRVRPLHLHLRLPSAIAIHADLLAELYVEARASYPAECCGYLVGPAAGHSVSELVRCRNAQPDGEHPTHPGRGADTGYVISGSDLFQFARSLTTELPARVVYHSHTNGRAYFSAVDEANAIAGDKPTYPVQHLVIGVTDQGVTEAAQYAWDEAAGRFVEVARWDARC